MKTFRLFDEFNLYQSTSSSLLQFLRQRQISHEQRTIKNSIHIKSQQKGFQIEYEVGNKQQKLSAIFIYKNMAKFGSYPQNFSLPFRLCHKISIKAVVMLLGEPTAKSKYGIQCVWKQLGMDISFIGNGWMDQKSYIEYLCLYQQQSNNCATLCCVCHKKVENGVVTPLQCSDCKIIRYCSESCRQKHYRLHKMYCQNIDQS